MPWRQAPMRLRRPRAAEPLTERAAQMAAFVEIARSAQLSSTAAASLRTAELVTRAALAGGATPVSGPRVSLPAGLGGAVIGHQAAMTAYAPPHGAHAMTPAAPTAPGAGAAREVRGFAPVWATTAQSTSSIAAVAEARPAGIAHLGWADRWLARFAGASPDSLAALDAGSERLPAMPRALAAGSPEIVFVVPRAESAQRHADAMGEAGPVPRRAPGSRPAAAMPTVAPAQPVSAPQAALRIADDEATPDAVLHAIARAARPGVRDVRPPRAATAPTGGEVAFTAPGAPAMVDAPALPTVADRVARAVPVAPAAGLHAQLASSPMAPALTSVLGLPAAPAFDPRALYPAGALAAYLSGASSAPTLTRFAAPALTRFAAPTHAHFGTLGEALDVAGPAGVSTRAPEQTLVAPAPGARDAQRDVDVAAAASPRATAAAAAQASTIAARAEQARWQVHAPLLATPTFAGEMNDDFDGATATTSPVPGPIGTRQLAELGATGPATAEARGLAAPLVAAPEMSWTARPGGTAERSQQMAIARERAAADLAFDFVSPELVLAARVYGFGPAEAAQASRLAVQGHGGLSAMASTLDLTFLRQLQATESAAPRGEAAVAGGARATAPAGAPAGQAPIARPSRVAPLEHADVPATVSSLAASAPAQPVVTAYPLAAPPSAASAGAAAGTVFGVERRLPRGAFLWPAGAVGAMDLQAQVPGGRRGPADRCARDPRRQRGGVDGHVRRTVEPGGHRRCRRRR